jgi:hypothetical protein
MEYNIISQRRRELREKIRFLYLGKDRASNLQGKDFISRKGAKAAKEIKTYLSQSRKERRGNFKTSLSHQGQGFISRKAAKTQRRTRTSKFRSRREVCRF